MMNLTQVLSFSDRNDKEQTWFFVAILCSLSVLCVLLSFLQDYLHLIAFPELMSRMCKTFCNQEFKLITSVSEFSCNKKRTAGGVEITFISCHITDWICLPQCSKTAGTGIFDGFWLLLFVFSGQAWWWWSEIICISKQSDSRTINWVGMGERVTLSENHLKTRIVCIIGAFKHDRLSFRLNGSSLFQQGLLFYNSSFLFAR